MKFLYIIFTITVLNVLFITEITATFLPFCHYKSLWSRDDPRCVERVDFDTDTDWNYIRSRINFRNGFCNDGFEMINSKCEPVCKPSCGNGTCMIPNECHCHEGYSQINTKVNSTTVCIPVCTPACSHGQCIAPETCSCDHQYSLTADGYTCEPVCVPNCGPGSFCSIPNHCTCLKGYTIKNEIAKEDDNADTFNLCTPVCDKQCINSQCTAPNVCTCNDGYLPDPDNIFACVPICERLCINGKCTGPNVCTCNDGFRHNSSDESTKHICEPHCKISCEPFGICTAPNVCTCYEGHRLVNETEIKENVIFANNSICEPICYKACINGFCSAPDTCSCNPGYHLLGDNSTNICEPSCNHSCINGFCSAPETCTCNEGYQFSNSSNVCESVCQVDCVNGYCSAPDKCTCNSGYEFDETNRTTMRQTICKPICNISCGNGTCTAPDFCTCFDGYQNTETGPCKPICSQCNNGTCIAPNICKCNDGFVRQGSIVDFRVSKSGSTDNFTNVNSCIPHCENCDNGECVMPHECRCYPGFVNIQGSCVAACENGCGTHGKCIEKRRICECDFGWTGLQCDQPTLCVLFLYDNGNRTEKLEITEKNATIENVLKNNPVCSKCIDKINNETLCFKIKSINDTSNEIEIGCLMDGECVSLISQSKLERGINRSSADMSIIAGAFGILLLISIAAVYVIHVLRRRHQQNYIDLVADNDYTTSMQGLIENSENK